MRALIDNDGYRWTEESAAKFGMQIPIGITVFFTIEVQQPGLFRHLSVAVDLPGRVPHPAIVECLLPKFGMPPIDECLVVRQEAGGGQDAMNLWSFWRKA